MPNAGKDAGWLLGAVQEYDKSFSNGWDSVWAYQSQHTMSNVRLHYSFLAANITDLSRMFEREPPPDLLSPELKGLMRSIQDHSETIENIIVRWETRRIVDDY